MRVFFVILVCKLLHFIGKLIGKGSSLPGKYALKLDRNILKKIKMPEYIIAVTGSNGKTSTVEMIAHILQEGGKTVAYNKEGSNQIEGVTTFILCNSTMGGKVKSDILLIESDERFAQYTFKYFKPTHYVITNLYRDQLTRNGHPEWVYDCLKNSIHDGTQLILNADDPLVSCFGYGKDDVICKVYMAIIAGGHVLLDDIPGVGKTTMAHAFANALGLKYNRIQFTPDVMPSDITGFSMYNRQTGKFEFKQGAAMCNLLLADEINRTSPKTQSALLQIMEESKVTVDGNTYELPDPFVVIATQNPIGSIGTQKLPESQLDRFMIKLSMGYPQIEDEVAIMKSRLENGKNTQFSACVLEKGDIKGIREEVAGIYVDDSIYEYVAKIAAKTRSRENIIQGVSPRGSIAVIAMAKAEAFLRGNNYVLPSDIKNIAVETFAHRIVTNVNGAAGTEAARKEITEILRNVPVPEMNK